MTARDDNDNASCSSLDPTSTSAGRRKMGAAILRAIVGAEEGSGDGGDGGDGSWAGAAAAASSTITSSSSSWPAGDFRGGGAPARAEEDEEEATLGCAGDEARDGANGIRAQVIEGRG